MKKGLKKNDASERRKFPRKPTEVKVKLVAVGSKGVTFEAHLPSSDVSIGGIFLHSEFFMKLGTELLVEFELPGVAEPVNVKGVVVREQRATPGLRNVRTGFAVEFTEFVDDARISLASFFLAPTIREFVKKYSRTERHTRYRDQTERLVDLIVAWEMDCLDRGAGRTIA